MSHEGQGKKRLTEEEVAAKIAAYTPRKIDAGQWDDVAAFVRGVVVTRAAAEPDTLGVYLTLAAQFVVWAHHERGLALSVEGLFVDELIDAWLAAKIPHGRHAPVRSQLRLMNDSYVSKLVPVTVDGKRLDPSSADPELVAAKIDAYIPTGVEETTWARVSQVAREAVRASAPRTVGTAARRVREVAGYLVWCDGQDLPVDRPAAIWSSSTIERYVARAIQGRGASSAGTIRSILVQVARAVSKSAMPPRAAGYRASEALVPYGDHEIVRLRQAAEAEPTPARRDALWGLLCLTVGAGLNSPDVPWVRGADVRREDDGTTLVDVDAGGRSRTVVVDDAWADQLGAVAARAGTRPLIGDIRRGNIKSVGRLVERLTLDTTLRPLSVNRLRDTWLRIHIDAGTPTRVILDQIHASTLSPIERILEHLAVPDDKTRREVLRRCQRPLPGPAVTPVDTADEDAA